MYEISILIFAFALGVFMVCSSVVSISDQIRFSKEGVIPSSMLTYMVLLFLGGAGAVIIEIVMQGLCTCLC